MSKLFVYGTLKLTPHGVPHHLLADAVLIDSLAMVQGNLYDLGAFPGYKKGEGTVHGELYEIDNPYTWQRLDAYEGVPHLYQRIKVFTNDGQETYIYEYQGEPREEHRIVGGAW